MTKNNMLKWLAFTVVLLMLDKATKLLALTNLTLYHPVKIFPGFNLTLAFNEGAAFSFLSDAGGWQRWLFAAIAMIITVVFTIWLKRLPNNAYKEAFAISLILSGGLGNLWDRLQYGYVVDYLQVYYKQWYWPVFNVADIAISVGAILLVLTIWHNDKAKIKP